MINIDKVSRLGIGTYRMTDSIKEHENALLYALDNGINLIDTASNYQFGHSENLIGKVLNKNNRKNTFLISKAGYINGEDIKRFSRLLNSNNTIKINDNFLYSIAPTFIEAQIAASLDRLNTDYLDGFLIHNPEHYFDVANQNQKYLYQHLIESFTFLETLVNKGIIRYYGISSNTLANKEVDLKKIIKDDNNFPNFKLAQFPYNLIENDASLHRNSESLIDFCHINEIKTLANRPLNTTVNGKVLRLADYSGEIQNVNFEAELDLFNELLDLIKNQLEKFGETSEPEDFSPIKFFINNRTKIANPEAVNKAVKLHLIPFLTQLQFLPASKVYFLVSELEKYWVLYSKKYISERVLILKESLIAKGVIIENDERDFSCLACEKYLADGIDHVLVGMRKRSYIDKLLPLL